MERTIEIRRPYRHFKGKLYYIHDIAVHTETEELMVSYQALYPPYGMWVRPLKMFVEEVEPGREDNITGQKYRFELYRG
ncbi:DUF1653 domain-containing protein [Niameybacter massiliensis]|uniref:DUF1653 domain-containing protein n=1 Tax=Holtiella tumoricola TaxID=3018743 RepID=A0AA42DLE9_9FIRM|nr:MULTISPECIES: DUF1653 domain-containing protein [Lachnospirales]MDA3731159.1 DUF1653 domain-containing protein [Holtiella tumoricola]